MVDYMIESLVKLNIISRPHKVETLFLTVSIMDRFFQDCQVKSLTSTSDLLKVGITAMFIASKFEGGTPLKLKKVMTTLGGGKFTLDEIKMQERIILRDLNHQVSKPTA